MDHQVVKRKGNHAMYHAMYHALQAAIEKVFEGVVCPYCGQPARMVKGTEIYPHRKDLEDLNFWRCEPCDAHVGCHLPNRKMAFTGIEPKGRLANPELRKWRMRAHECFDPLWKSGPNHQATLDRSQAYSWLAQKLKMKERDCHIGWLDVDLCKKVVEVCGFMGSKALKERGVIK